jgi:hypothetical protein
VVAEGRAGGFDVGREFGSIEWLLGRRGIFFGNNVVDGLFHLLLFFICWKKIQLISPLPSRDSTKNNLS